jgi:formate dehydrogenase iron-sulfur subunit
VQRVWGENEVGGTSVLYVSDVDLNLTDLDAPISDTVPVPERTFKVLSKMPTVFFGVAAAMGGIYWIIERRQRLAAQNETESDEG